MDEQKKEQLHNLIKERDESCITFTKYKPENPISIQNEVTALKFISSLGIAVPRIICSSENFFCTEYVQGLSAFQVLERLHHSKDQKIIFSVLDSLCSITATIQKNINQIKFLEAKPYDVNKKLSDVVSLLQEDNRLLAKEIQDKIKTIILEYKNSSMPFLDRTPKNFLIADVDGAKQNFTLSSQFNDFDLPCIFCIDFASVGEYTLPDDDYISILFHYMIDPAMRDELLIKYGVDVKTKAYAVAGFVRFARFWVRRAYYKKYWPNQYQKRYPFEKFSFYESKFVEFANLVIEKV